MTPYEISLLLYNIALLPVVFLSALFFILALTHLFMDVKIVSKKKTLKTKDLPFITVQIPSFNDPVAVRCIDACLKLDYPKNKLQLMVLDDSTDEQTRKLLKAHCKKNGIDYVYRTNRQGYKPGALQDAMHRVRGEIIVIFDADFIPEKSFLKKIAEPFEDPKVAIVQGRQGIMNKDVNLVSRFASYLLIIHHHVMMPINHKSNSVFFCGTAGAIRKSAMMAAGGWNPSSITEDTELSVRILRKGYKTVYVPFETPSEVPVTIESFLKQQMRWCYGNLRVFIDNASTILWKKGLTVRQRFLISYMTVGNIVAPVVLIMTLAGLGGWFLGEPKLATAYDFIEFSARFFYTAGFFALGAAALWRKKSLREFPKMVASTLALGILLAAANTVAMFRAVFMKNKPLYPGAGNSWISTPKTGNLNYAGR